MRNGLLYRRSPHVVSYWAGGELLIENYATRIRARASPLAIELMHFFHEWKTLPELVDEYRRFDAKLLVKAVGLLTRRSLLQRSDRPLEAEACMEEWAGWNPAAGFLHLSTKDVPYVKDHELGERLLVEQARTNPMPPVAKAYARALRLELPPPRSRGSLPRALLDRRTWRRFSRRPLDLGSLATLLGLTFKVQGWMDLGGLGKVPLKTSPSGGARHSIEAYVVALRVTGLRPGLYHYASDRHALEAVRMGATRRSLGRYLPSQPWFADAPVVVLMTSVFPRVQWRYPHPRAYRVVLAEAGHLCQTFLLAATWLGLAPFCTMALGDTAIERDLRLDGITESVLYAAGVGIRPRGGRGQIPR